MTSRVPELPDNPLARTTLELVTATESPPIANHSIRSYLFAMMLAARRGLRPDRDFDPQLVFLACTLHDLGLTPDGNREQRFEVDGADIAAEFLTNQGLPDSEVETVWEAIALHTSPGIAERRGVVCELTRRGVGADFGREVDFIPEDQALAIHAAWPRLAIARSLSDLIVAQAIERPAKAPAYSIAAGMVRERADVGRTGVEAGAAMGRWGS